MLVVSLNATLLLATLAWPAGGGGVVKSAGGGDDGKVYGKSIRLCTSAVARPTSHLASVAMRSHHHDSPHSAVTSPPTHTCRKAGLLPRRRLLIFLQ